MEHASNKSGWSARLASLALSCCLCVAGTLFVILSVANYLRATLWLQLDAESALLLKQYGPPPVHPFIEFLVGLALAGVGFGTFRLARQAGLLGVVAAACSIAFPVFAIKSVYGSTSRIAFNTLDRALILPDNRALVAWGDQQHEFVPPQPRMGPLPFSEWDDQASVTVRWEGGVRVVDPTRQAVRRSIAAPFDHALADAVEAHFGYPHEIKECYGLAGDDSLKEVTAMRDRLLAKHGVCAEKAVLRPDFGWIVRNSIDCVRPVAKELVVGCGSRRARIEALAGYVQGAIPYTPDVEGEQDSRFRDGKHRLDLRTPGAVLLRGGDCDSKSLLLAALMRSVDPSVPICVVSIDRISGDNHAILGIGVNSEKGEAFWDSPRGPVLLIETTDQWGMGRLSEVPDPDRSTVRWID